MRILLAITVSLFLTSNLSGYSFKAVFNKHFDVKLPESYKVEFVGGKDGEEQYAIYGQHQKHLLSFFIYYDGLDPRAWGYKHSKQKWEFLYQYDNVFVSAELKDLGWPQRLIAWEVLSSIKPKLPQNISEGVDDF